MTRNDTLQLGIHENLSDVLTIRPTGVLNAYSTEELISKHSSEDARRICLDFSAVTSVKPGGVCMLACLLAHLGRHLNRRVTLVFKCEDQSIVDEMVRMGFFSCIMRWVDLASCKRLLEIDQENRRAFYVSEGIRRHKTLPLEVFADERLLNLQSVFESDCRKFVNRTSDVFAKVLEQQLDSDQIKEFWRVNVELFKNVYNHSESWGIACISSGLSEGSVFCFHDNGLGICETAKRVVGDAKDSELIFWALKEGNTSKEGNSGLGLAILRDFVVSLGGLVHIRSGTARIKSSAAKDTVDDVVWFPGTHVDCFIPNHT